MSVSFRWTRLLKGASWSVVGRLLEAAARAIAVVALARVLGPAQFGVLLVALSIVSLLSLFADMGLSAATGRLLAERPGDSWAILGTGGRALLLAAGLASGFLALGLDSVASALGAPAISDLRGAMVALLVASMGHKFVAKALEGLRHADLAGKVAVAIGWLPWPLALGVVLVRGQTTAAAISGLAGGNVAVLFVLAAVTVAREAGAQPVQARGVSLSQLLRYALPLMALTAGSYVFTQSDIVLVEYFLDSTEVGYYGTATRVVQMLLIPASAIASAAVGYLVLRPGEGAHQQGVVLRVFTQGVLIVYLPVAGILATLAPELVHFVFGSAFVNAGVVLVAYIPFILSNALSATQSLALNYLGYGARRAIYVGIAAGVNILLNLILVPLWGILGAAVATQVTYVPLVVWQMRLVRNITGEGLDMRFCAKVAVSLAIALAGSLLVARVVSAHVFVRLLTLVLVYVSVGWLTGAIRGPAAVPKL